MADVTNFEKRIIKRFKLTPQTDIEKAAIHSCALIESLGFEVTLQQYELSVKSHLEVWERKHGNDAAEVRAFIAAAEAGDQFTDAWCDNGLTDDRPYRPGVMDGDVPF